MFSDEENDPLGLHEHGDVLHWMSVSILSIFCLEILGPSSRGFYMQNTSASSRFRLLRFVFPPILVAGLIIAFGWRFFTHVGYILDLVVVPTSLCLELFVSDAAGLLVILRLWRLVRVAHGVYESVAKYQAAHHHTQAEREKQLASENLRAEDSLPEDDARTRKLLVFLAKQNRLKDALILNRQREVALMNVEIRRLKDKLRRATEVLQLWESFPGEESKEASSLGPRIQKLLEELTDAQDDNDDDGGDVGGSSDPDSVHSAPEAQRRRTFSFSGRELNDYNLDHYRAGVWDPESHHHTLPNITEKGPEASLLIVEAPEQSGEAAPALEEPTAQLGNPMNSEQGSADKDPAVSEKTSSGVEEQKQSPPHLLPRSPESLRSDGLPGKSTLSPTAQVEFHGESEEEVQQRHRKRDLRKQKSSERARRTSRPLNPSTDTLN